MDFDYGIWPTSEKEGRLRCRFIIVTLVYDIMAFITSQSSIGIPNVANKQLVHVHFIKPNYLTLIDQFLLDFKPYIYSFIYHNTCIISNMF